MKFFTVAAAYLSNIGMPIVTFFGVFRGSEYAMNVVIFLCWLAALMATLGLIMMIADESGNARQGAIDSKICPLWLDYTTDTIALAFLVVTGHFLLASLWLYQIFAYTCLFNLKVRRDDKEKST